MAPASHTCDPSSNITIASPPAVHESCQPDPYAGSNLLSFVPPPTVPVTTVRSQSTTDDAAANLMKEPVFIAAMVLTLLILLGGLVVMRLSKLPKRKRLAAKTRPPGKSLVSNEISSIPTPDYGTPFVETVVKPEFGYASSHSLVGGAETTQPYPHRLGAAPQIVLSEPEEDLFEVDLTVAAEVQKDDREMSRPSRRESWSRPRQDSDASESTEDTETGPPDHIFSSASSISSITSASEQASDDEDDEEQYESADDGESETVFEVKRGHAQSMELIKGVLMSWPAAGESSNTVDLEEAEVRKVLPVPALIVTQPSTLSLFTMDSSASNMSVDLGQFPLPPLHLEPAIFWQRLEEEINTSIVLKRQSKV
ncbi:hypothetical protein MD484_g1858, partial [Candolleomyces efflorescens]